MTYTEGRQPCPEYQPQRADTIAGGANEHECFGPYPPAVWNGTCAGHVSFCLTCSTDHHTGGWETCGQDSGADR